MILKLSIANIWEQMINDLLKGCPVLYRPGNIRHGSYAVDASRTIWSQGIAVKWLLHLRSCDLSLDLEHLEGE